MIKLGEKQTLVVVKKVEFGVYLAESKETAEDRILLPVKQVPEGAKIGDKVEVFVGSAEHPMEEVHSIQWIYVETENGGYRKDLKPGEAPAASFNVQGEKVVAVYEYCNLHGLWKTEV